MNPREAMKEVLKLLFEHYEERSEFSFAKEEIETAIENMHDDDEFLEQLIRFFADHVETYGENYGLEFPEDYWAIK